MTYEVLLPAQSNGVLCNHLLQHYRKDELQEDLCFALWRPSTGATRTTALIDTVLLPEVGERTLHGNASFSPHYLGRAANAACKHGMGLAFLHSHPTPGWQGMSTTDILAERDVIAYPAMATQLPLVGLTVGIDGYWSARVWQRSNENMVHQWCPKVRVVGPHKYSLYFHDTLLPPPSRKERLRRTFDTWGSQAQDTIARLHVGIVGLGSVGCLVAECMARIGVSRLTLIDPDRVEEHNLDRLLYGTQLDVNKTKVDLAQQHIERNSTADNISITSLRLSIHDAEAYKAALDCDVIFSCVDRPLARDVLNYIANAHVIPVIDGGIAIETDNNASRLFSAHWRAHLVTPYHCCMRCNGQYNSSMVVMELDGSLDDPSYVRNLPPNTTIANQNVFPFSLSAAGLEVNLMLRYLLAEDWWPIVKQQDYQFVTAETRIVNQDCFSSCTFLDRHGQGDTETPTYIRATAPVPKPTRWHRFLCQVIKVCGMIFRTR